MVEIVSSVDASVKLVFGLGEDWVLADVYFKQRSENKDQEN